MLEELQEQINAMMSNDEPSQNTPPLEDVFKHPIQYLDASNLYVLQDNVCSDLEIVFDSSKNDPSANTMCHYLTNPCDDFARKTLHNHVKYYTNKITYLTDTQTVIKNIN